jgi:hypothetical protein
MKTWKLSKLSRLHWALLGVVLLGTALSLASPTLRRFVRRHPAALSAALLRQPPATPGQTAAVAPVNATFTIRSYGGKCLEFGMPLTRIEQVTGKSYPVFISDCKGTAAQQVRIEELTDRPGHLVILRAGNGVIGKKVTPVFTQLTASEAQSDNDSTDSGAAEQASSAALAFTSTVGQIPLEVQPYTGSPGQIFALDGDSMILAADCNLVVEVQNHRGKNQTPLVLGRRDLDDSEFWTFTATDGSNRRPTSGFVRISQIDNSADGELRARTDFLHAVFGAKWGTVIELDPNVSLNLSDTPPLHIPAGVTIRGDRRGTRPGPLLQALNQERQKASEVYGLPHSGMLFINGDHVRITGLRMQGPSRIINDYYRLEANAIATLDHFISIIDHNEMFDWTAAAVYVGAVIPGNRDLHSRPQNAPKVRVARNFIHHTPPGYGVGTYDSYVSIEGNTFITNRHAIAASSGAFSAYRAWFNLVLSASPGDESAFDAHGTGDDAFGGTAGHYFEIAYNTFLCINRENFELRGEPGYLAEFHHNVSIDPITRQAVKCSGCGDRNKLSVSDTNQFKAPNPTTRLGVGDFDGDGEEDLFLATGAAWYYAPAGQAEWRFLNAQTDKIDTLLFGDFDADGRTDVFTQHGYNWEVSWGGASRWEKINVSWAILGNAAIGDFIGDERDDVFYADGQTWYVSDGGASQFTPLDASSFRVASLRFGDFDANGKTDVFSVVSGYWQVAYSGTSGRQPLRTKLSDSVANLTIADFNGDGRADVATSSLGIWKVSYSGTGNWTTLRTTFAPLASAAAIGRFDGSAGADVLLWNSRSLNIASGGAGTAVRHSREDLR